jgi:hypothetical protein
MFETVAKVGGLEVQLVYFLGAGKFEFSEWTNNAHDLAAGCAGFGAKPV